MRVPDFQTGNYDEEQTAPIDDIDAASQLRIRHRRMTSAELTNI